MERSAWTCLSTNYTRLLSGHVDPSTLQRGGVALLIPPDSAVSATIAKTWQETRITAATWKLSRADWTADIYVTGIYKSPGQNMSQLDINSDTATIAEILASIPSSSLHIVAGNFNLHTAAAFEGPHASDFPPQWGDRKPVNAVGLALLGLLSAPLE